MRVCLRWASMAASKERMVSSGRSSRLRVGFERSGSAELCQCVAHQLRTRMTIPIIFPSRSRCCMLRRENVPRSPGWLFTVTIRRSADGHGPGIGRGGFTGLFLVKSEIGIRLGVQRSLRALRRLDGARAFARRAWEGHCGIVGDYEALDLI